jgi:hypothetical protein
MALVKLRVLCDGWRQKYKDEDGDWITERHVRGDVVEMEEKFAKKLLADNGARRKQFVKAGSDDDPFREGADDSDDEPTLSVEERENTTQEGKPAGSSMPRTTTTAKK